MEDGFIVFICLIFALIIGGFIGGNFCEDHYQKQAIQHNCAEYSTTTGEWRWKENNLIGKE
jgi:hypothetical protein